MKIWTLSEFKKSTGVHQRKLSRLINDGWIEKNKNEKGYKIITEEDLFKIAISLLVTNIGAKQTSNSLTDKFSSYLSEGNELGIAYHLLNEFEEDKEIINKIIFAYGDTDYMLNIIKFLKQGEIEVEKIPRSKASEELTEEYKPQFIEQIDITIDNYKNLISSNDLELLKEAKRELIDFFNTTDLLLIKEKFKSRDINYFYPIQADNKELFSFLDSKDGRTLNNFTTSFYKFIKVLLKHPKLTTKINYDLEQVPSMTDLYYESIHIKDSLKDRLAIPFLGYSDHHDGYYLPHKILRMKYHLKDYKNAFNDLEKVLEKKIVDINAKDKYNTIVRIAVDNQDIEVLKLLKRFGADPFKDYAFSIAIEKQNQEVIEQMIELVPNSHHSSLLKDIYAGNLEVVESLLNLKWEGLEEIIKKEQGAYSLGLAVLAKSNKQELLQLLRDKVNEPDYDRILINVCISLKNEEIAIPFVKYIDPLDSSTGDTYRGYPACTYLALAAQQKSFKLAEEFFKQADPNHERFNLVLHEFAIFTGHDKLWKLFLNRAKELELTKKYGFKSPLDVLMSKHRYKRIKQLITKAKKDEYSKVYQLLSDRLNQFKVDEENYRQQYFENKDKRYKEEADFINEQAKYIEDLLDLIK